MTPPMQYYSIENCPKYTTLHCIENVDKQCEVIDISEYIPSTYVSLSNNKLFMKLHRYCSIKDPQLIYSTDNSYKSYIFMKRRFIPFSMLLHLGISTTKLEDESKYKPGEKYLTAVLYSDIINSYEWYDVIITLYYNKKFMKYDNIINKWVPLEFGAIEDGRYKIVSAPYTKKIEEPFRKG